MNKAHDDPEQGAGVADVSVLNPAQKHILDRLSDEICKTCVRVANEEWIGNVIVGT